MENFALEFVRVRSTAVLGTITRDGGVQVAAIHYVVDSDSSFLFKSRATSDHISVLPLSNSAALTVYRHDSSFAKKAGIQLKGKILRITDETCMAGCVELYSEVFAGAREHFDPVSVLVRPDAPSTLFRFVPELYKLVDGWSDRFDREYRPW
jgi:uncharacterized protein YhbP (UPF0306 family)